MVQNELNLKPICSKMFLLCFMLTILFVMDNCDNISQLHNTKNNLSSRNIKHLNHSNYNVIHSYIKNIVDQNFKYTVKLSAY